MTFTVVATAAAVASLLLGVGFLLSGPLMLEHWGLHSPAESLVMSRRIGAVCEGMGLAIARLATLGLYEWRARRVSAGIAVSTVVAFGLATSFMWVR